MPVGVPLVGIARAQSGRLGKGRGQDLQPDRQTFGVETTRDHESRDSGQVGRVGKDVREVHRERVGGFFSQAECVLAL